MATDLQITNTIYNGKPVDSKNPTLTAWLTVTWKNSWRTDKNYDAVWIFFKFNAKEDSWSRIPGILKKTGHGLIHNYLPNNVGPSFFVPDDGMGVMIYPDKKYRGDVSWRIKVEFDIPKISGLDKEDLVLVYAHGIEMVYIPQGPFYAGESDTTVQRSAGAFHEGGTRDYYKVNSENEIQIGDTKGNLNYNNNNLPEFRGDVKGPVPASFPKGFDPFYIMKYELTDGNYIDFLNSIGVYFSNDRANFGGRNYYKERGSIRLDGDEYKTDSRQRPASFLSWDDDCAFADWAGLRPMTELEFEKACRGPVRPVMPNSFPWGTNSKEKLSRYYDRKGDLVLEPPLNEKDINDVNLEYFGASYYWVMDLNGSVWERCVTLGNERGRSFVATHGDGRLAPYKGTATNEDWPNNRDGKGGISYRGGGYYIWNMAAAPQGEVGHRNFGAWGEGTKGIAYGFRAVRSAEPPALSK